MSQHSTPALPVLTDEEFEAIKSLINTTIHELVFACQLAEDNEMESAQDALFICQNNLERVAARVATAK